MDLKVQGGLLGRLGMAIALLFVAPVFCTALIMGGCEEEKRQETEPPKPLVRMKIPPGKATAPERAGEEKAPAVQEPVAESRAPSPPEQAAPAGKAEQTGLTEGLYLTRRGDSLSAVAGREEIYNDPMKWPSLYRLNLDRLKDMKETADIHTQVLPEGMGLKFVTPQEAKENLSRLAGREWVVNVLSSPDAGKIVPAAVILMKSGYDVYISRTMVKGKEWLRLRAGFYRDREEANSAGKKMMALLGADGAWIAKIGEEERAAFAGY